MSRRPVPARSGFGSVAFAAARALAVAALSCAALVSCTKETPDAPSAASAAPATSRQASAERLDPAEAALPYPSFTWPPTEEALAAGFDSPTEVAWMAVGAIDRNDQKRMHRLLIDETTYLEKLWPSFEAEKPANTIPAQFHWDLLEMKSLGGIIDMTREHAGRGYRLRTVTYEFVKDYVLFKLYRHTRVIVEDPLTGENLELRLFGDIVEIDGKHKLLSYPS